jgi:hypothetical protein
VHPTRRNECGAARWPHWRQPASAAARCVYDGGGSARRRIDATTDNQQQRQPAQPVRMIRFYTHHTTARRSRAS